MRSVFDKLNKIQILKYYTLGAFINFIGYLFYLFFLKVKIDYKIAASVLYIAGAIVSFFLNRKLVFKSSNSLKSGVIKHVVMLASGYFLNISILYFFVDIKKLDSKIVILFSTVIVSIYFYVFNKYFVHKSYGL